MRSGLAPSSPVCPHYRRARSLPGPVVGAAVPGGVQDDIFGQHAGHRLAYAGGHGIRFEAKSADGAEYVEELYGPVELAEAAS